MQLVTVGGAIATKPVCLRKPRGAAAGAECIAVQQISVIVPMIDSETVLPRDRAAKNEEQLTRSEEHTSELQSLMRISYAVFCLKKKHQTTKHTSTHIMTT